MKEQNFVSPGALKAAFESRKQEHRSGWKESGVVAAIEALSTAIRDLQDIGVDVHLQLSNVVFEDSWSLMKDVTGRTVELSGVLKIDQNEHLLAIAAQEKETVEEVVVVKGKQETKKTETNKPVLKIYLSDRDFTARTLKHDSRSRCYDLKEDPDAMHKLQQRIITIASANEAIREHDVGNAFENNNGITRLSKPAQLPKPGRP